MSSKSTVKEIEIEEKLRALYDLQLIDSRKDQISFVLGELPLEVEDLQNDLEGYNVKITKLEDELKELELSIKQKKKDIINSQELIAKYKKQQDDVRNNREFNSLTKEIEFQELEIQLSQKRINEYQAKIEFKNEIISQTKEQQELSKAHLESKKLELNELLSGTEKEQKYLDELSETYKKQIEPRLLNAYEKIRTKVSNGMAVVSIERGASSGSYFTIPPQKQLEIAQRKKIMFDEHSGRILVDQELADEEKDKMSAILSKI